MKLTKEVFELKEYKLNKIHQTTKQKIFECISQAVSEDRQEAEALLGLKTHVSRPFLNWDLIYRNLINAFPEGNIKYATKKCGMWEVLLLYDENSGLLLSFMRDTRFDAIRRQPAEKRPIYVRSLLTLNSELQAETKQTTLFANNLDDESDLMRTLNELCLNFECDIDENSTNHALVVFSSEYGRVGMFKAFILDRDFDVVYEEDWLDSVKPIMSNEIETAEEVVPTHITTLTPKALERLKKKELVELREQEKQKETQE